MKFWEWKEAHHLTAREVAAMIGVTENALSLAKKRDSYSPVWDAFSRLAAAEPLPVSFKNDGGQPVVCFGDDPLLYGPADVIRNDGRIAAHVVAIWALNPDRPEKEYQMARRFLRYWPKGPQLR